MTHMRGDDFYEDDEPVEKLLAAFDSGESGLTGRSYGWTRTLSFSTPPSGDYFVRRHNSTVGVPGTADGLTA